MDLMVDPRDGERARRVPRRFVHVGLLRGFVVTYLGRQVEVPLNEQRLLAFLAVNDRRLLRSYVAGTLWLDSSEKRALGNLRSAIWRLQRAAPGIVEASRTHVSLGPEVGVDLRRMTELASVLVHRVSGVDPTAVQEALLCGELLPGWYDEWVVVERERVRQLQLHALEALCGRLLAFGNPARAVRVGLAAVAAEPLRESARQLLIQAHLAEGNVAEAFRQYDQYRLLLSSELGIDPSPTIKRLVGAGGLSSTA